MVWVGRGVPLGNPQGSSMICTCSWLELVMATSSSSTSTTSTVPRKKVSAIGHTTFPKEQLSFKWTISENIELLMTVKNELKSPHFKVLLPGKDGSKIVTTWHLDLSIPPFDSDGNYWISLCCLECEDAEAQPPNFSSFWISDCVFTVLNSRTGEVKHTTEPEVEDSWVKNIPHIGPTYFFSEDKLDDYVTDGCLTVEVTASLHFFDDSVSVSTESTPIPSCNVMEGMKKVHERMPFSDVTIKCGDEEFKAHKVILASQSPVFDRMFETDMKESRDNVIEIADIDSAVMEDLIAFMYTGKPPHLNTLAKDLLRAADKYEMPRLVVLCENELMLNLHVDNLLESVQVADTYGAPNLKKTCVRMIKCHSTELLSSRKWQDFKESSHKELVFEILESNKSS